MAPGTCSAGKSGAEVKKFGAAPKDRGMAAMRRALALIALAGCAETTARGTSHAPETYGGGDGSSCAQRVIIHAPNEQAGADAETNWLLSTYPGHHRGTQKLGKCDDHPVDTVERFTGLSAGDKAAILGTTAAKLLRIA